MSEWRRFLDEFHTGRAGITERVLRQPGSGTDPYRWLAGAVLERTRPGTRVLDLACGSAPLPDLLPGRRWLGTDASAAELGLAARRGASPLLRADAAALPLGTGAVDAVVCGMALQVLTPLDRVLAEVHRVLRPGGVLVAMVPAARPLHAGDVRRYARLLLALRLAALPYPNADDTLAPALAAAGLEVRVDARRRHPFAVREPADGVLLVRSLYLPGVGAARTGAAERVARRWVGADLGVPLRLLVARRGAAGVPSTYAWHSEVRSASKRHGTQWGR